MSNDLLSLHDATAFADATGHVAGTSMYVDDLPLAEGTCYALAFGSPIAHGTIRNLDLTEASALEGVVRIFTCRDIPGQNQIGGIVPDETLLAEDIVEYRGQPIALIVAMHPDIAHAARNLIRAEIDPLEIVTDPRQAFEKGMFLHGSRTFRLGDSRSAFDACDIVVEGSVEIGGQEHVYIEPQGVYVIPGEHDTMRICSSTQGPTHVQKTIARVLNVPMHKIEVDVGRIGGGFGGKEDQATMWAALAALAAYHLSQPVRYILDRKDDMMMTGKRHPYSCDYKLGLDKDLRLIAYEATYFQNGGAAADLSPAVLERTLFHGTNSYDIPHVTMTAHCCKTHLPPNTAFRGFGGPQGMVVIEAAIHHAAREAGVPAYLIQEKNLLTDGCTFPYGQVVADALARSCWETAVSHFDLQEILRSVHEFNNAHPYLKKGVALMPVCFGISFTNTQMNQARALVHVYGDGSVGISTGAVEMGQGVNAKLVRVAAASLGIPDSLVHITSTNTSRVANTSPSAASATTDLNGKALVDACEQIMSRLRDLAATLLNSSPEQISIRDATVYLNDEPQDLSWHALITHALARRISLSAKGHYATPVIHFDKQQEKGHPFAYHVYGTAITIVEVDCLRGTYKLRQVSLVHDCGESIHHAVDIGQIEGGLVQGIGWMTTEELRYDRQGHLLSGSLATYKVPNFDSVPDRIDVHLLATDGTPFAIMKSKAVGEPPLMYGIGSYFALWNAILVYNPGTQVQYHTPMTPECVLMALYDNRE